MQVEWRRKNRTIEIKSLETVLYCSLNIITQFSFINIAIVVVYLELNWQTSNYFQTKCCIFFHLTHRSARREPNDEGLHRSAGHARYGGVSRSSSGGTNKQPQLRHLVSDDELRTSCWYHSRRTSLTVDVCFILKLESYGTYSFDQYIIMSCTVSRRKVGGSLIIDLLRAEIFWKHIHFKNIFSFSIAARDDTGSWKPTSWTTQIHLFFLMNISLGNVTQITIFMGPIWVRQGPGGPHVGPMNFVIWEEDSHIVRAVWYFLPSCSRNFLILAPESLKDYACLTPFFLQSVT